MVRFLAILSIAFLTASPLAWAEDRPQQDEAVASAGQAGTSRLDKLFMDLKRERNEQAARRIALRIDETWTNAAGDTAALLMGWANDAVKAEKFSVALDFLDQLVLLYPDYAEGWNRRATVHFMRKDYARSMADISRVLELEPRHFGALAGMARIFQDTNRNEQALAVYEQILDVYPMLRSAQKAMSEISDKLDGRGI